MQKIMKNKNLKYKPIKASHLMSPSLKSQDQTSFAARPPSWPSPSLHVDLCSQQHCIASHWPWSTSRQQMDSWARVDDWLCWTTVWHNSFECWVSLSPWSIPIVNCFWTSWVPFWSQWRCSWGCFNHWCSWGISTFCFSIDGSICGWVFSFTWVLWFACGS